MSDETVFDWHSWIQSGEDGVSNAVVPPEHLRCLCDDFSVLAPCLQRATQEDFLCDFCRTNCQYSDHHADTTRVMQSE